ncbi:MAG: discoidin domain-containing protein [Rhodocyclaceae bacterium]|nr:discoidin domain-containing protein [Rhodocyclaceae bacterium]
MTSDGVNWVSQSPQTGNDQVARDQIALTNIRLMLNSAITTGALVQGKQWDLASDEWGATSTSETYTAGTPNYYGNPGGYTADRIPTMTSETAPSGTVTKSGEVSGTVAAWKAFDKSASTYWQVSTSTSWISYDWGSGKTITQYTIQSRADNSHYPTAWTFDGWNGSAWVTLDTKSGQSFASGGTVKTYTISNSTAYNKYRLNITSTVSGTDVAIAEIAMMESSTPANITLIPDAAVTVSAAPTYMDCYFLWKDDSGSAVLGTDLTVELSRDGGTTYTTATLTNLASYDGTYSVIKARADVSGQPSGTSLLCRIKTLNTKAQRVAAPALYAE